MNPFCVILLDSDGRHPSFESRLGPRVERHTNVNACTQQIRGRMTTYRRIDLFLASRDENLIDVQLVLLGNVYLHVHYPTVDDIPHNAVPLMGIQRFEEADLWVEMSYTVLHHDWTDHRQSNYSNPTRLTLLETIDILLEEVREAKLSIEATN